MIEFKNIAGSVEGQILQMPLPENEIRFLLTDSRHIAGSAGSLFFAIKGEHKDGHAYVQELYLKGVRNFVIEQEAGLPVSYMTDANFIKVPNSIKALQQLVARHRQQFTYPVVGITGSNGKTIIKEWLSQLLAGDYTIVKSPKSYNSQIGVPLSVWDMADQHNLALFEAGISQVGEMAALQEIIQPTIGIFSNIGTAHDKGFSSREEKIQEKFILFKKAKTIIYCRDHAALHSYITQHAAPGQQLIGWSAKSNAFDLPFTDDASRENLGHCIALMQHLGCDAELIQRRISSLKNIPMRLELKKGINNCALVDDTYNNDLAGLSIALAFMKQQHIAPSDSKSVILSDMLETGQDKTVLYRQIARLLKENNIKRVIGIGEVINAHQDAFVGIGLKGSFYPDTQIFLEALPQLDFNKELILIKGARKFHFESIVQHLQEKVHGTRMEVNLEALAHNLSFYRSKLEPGTKIMVMVKAFSYGSGSGEVAALLQFHHVDYLAVAYADEGIALRQSGITLPIMVMNPSEATFSKLLEYNLEPEVYSFNLLEALLAYLKREGKNVKIHIKLDTGMRRLGFEPAEVPLLLTKLKEATFVTVASIFSHLAASENPAHQAFTRRQITAFTTAVQELEEGLGYKPIRHIVNSGGIIRFPDAHFDMVRLGIGLYGVEVSGQQQEALQAVSTLKTTISQIKHIPEGETIGYSRKGVASRDSTTATIAIGYADGFDRRFGQGIGKVLINGRKAPVIGSVCMDMTMVDITGIDAKEGDDVIVFGEGLSLMEQAEAIGTIPYELLTNVSERVKRVFFAG